MSREIRQNIGQFAVFGNTFQTNLIQQVRRGGGIQSRDENAWAEFTRKYQGYRAEKGLPVDRQWLSFSQLKNRVMGEAMGGQQAPKVQVYMPVRPTTKDKTTETERAQRDIRGRELDMELETLEEQRVGNDQDKQQETLQVQGGMRNSFTNQRIRQLTSTMGPWGKTLQDGNLLISKEYGYTGKWRKKDESQFVQSTPNLLRTSKIGSGKPFKSQGSELGENAPEFGKMTDPNVVHIPRKFHFFIFYFYLISNLTCLYLILLDSKLMTDHHRRNQQAMKNFERPFLQPKHMYAQGPPSGMNNQMSKEQMNNHYETSRPNKKM
jgi:hypothetical protein